MDFDPGKTLKDAAYITVGVGVIGFQQGQVRRREVQKKVTEQAKETSTLLATRAQDGRVKLETLANDVRAKASAARTTSAAGSSRSWATWVAGRAHRRAAPDRARPGEAGRRGRRQPGQGARQPRRLTGTQQSPRRRGPRHGGLGACPDHYIRKHAHGAGRRGRGGAVPRGSWTSSRPTTSPSSSTPATTTVPRPLRLPRPRQRHVHARRRREPRDRLGARRARRSRAIDALDRYGAADVVPPRRPRPRHPPVPHATACASGRDPVDGHRRDRRGLGRASPPAPDDRRPRRDPDRRADRRRHRWRSSRCRSGSCADAPSRRSSRCASTAPRRPRPAPGVLDALEQAETILVCPSNPVISIGPILAVPGVRDALDARRDRVVGVSPIIGGAPVKGPGRPADGPARDRGVVRRRRRRVPRLLLHARDRRRRRRSCARGRGARRARRGRRHAHARRRASPRRWPVTRSPPSRDAHADDHPDPRASPRCEPGDELAELLVATRPTAQDTPLADGDCLVVTQKVVSKAEGRLVPLEPDDPAARRALIESESVRVLRGAATSSSARRAHGFVCANAGVDLSNVDDGQAALLPVDPDRSARRIRDASGRDAGVDVARHRVRHVRAGVARSGSPTSPSASPGLAAVVDLRGAARRPRAASSR